MKMCPQCGEEKDISEFARKGVDRLQSWCKPCTNKRNSRMYRESPHIKTRLLAANKERKRGLDRILKEQKDVPCFDCGMRFPAECMDFDHREGVEKKFNISQASRRYGLPSILEEIAKCEVVCSNCHRIRTKRRRLKCATSDQKTPLVISSDLYEEQ
jgi:hypothetical protein